MSKWFIHHEKFRYHVENLLNSFLHNEVLIIDQLSGLKSVSNNIIDEAKSVALIQGRYLILSQTLRTFEK